MKIKKGFKLKTESGRQTVIADKRIYKDFTSVIILNEIAVYIWKTVADGIVTTDELITCLSEKFKMSKHLAKNNVDVFIQTMKENGILEE